MSAKYTPRFGFLPPPTLRFAGVPTWQAKNETLPESEWREHDDYANLWPAIRAQANNNCTNASLGPLGEVAFKLAGVEDVPTFSWAFNYSRHNDNRDQGAFCRDLIQDFRDGPGLMPVELWPDSRIYGGGAVTKEQLVESNKWRALEVYQCMSPEEAFTASTLGFLLYHGFVLGNGFDSTPKSGKVPRFDGRIENGHAMASRGITKRFGDWRFITPNTWGPNWGDRGVGYWDRSYFWLEKGNFINMECFAVRAVRSAQPLPPVT